MAKFAPHLSPLPARGERRIRADDSENNAKHVRASAGPSESRLLVAVEVLDP
jgi:hypothetical protein